MSKDQGITWVGYYNNAIEIDFRNEWDDIAVSSGSADIYGVNLGTPTPTPTVNCLLDAFEPDDTSATGSPIIMGDEQRHTLCPQNDQDWVNFDTSTNDYFNRNVLVETFDLEPDSIHPNGDTQLTVEDEMGTKIGTNQFRGFGPFPGSPDILESSRVVWHPAMDGLFNIKIFPQKQINEQDDSGYSLRMANPLTMVDPVDQGSWSPTRINVPYVSRFDNGFYFTQFFIYEQPELDALNEVRGTLAVEFRRPAVNPDTGAEVDESNVDYGDYYYRNQEGVCVGDLWSNIPNYTDMWTEELNSLDCSNEEPGLRDEEFELYILDTTELVAGKPYFIMIKFYVHDEHLNSHYQFYVTKAEYCELFAGTFDGLCNLATDLAVKRTSNLIEGYLQPVP